jgi:hypothetical protein
MNPLFLLSLTLFIPVVPWIFLIPKWLVDKFSAYAIWIVFGLGLVVDLWFAKPLGLTSIVLIALALLCRRAQEFWRVDAGIFWTVASLASLLILELELRLA